MRCRIYLIPSLKPQSANNICASYVYTYLQTEQNDIVVVALDIAERCHDIYRRNDNIAFAYSENHVCCKYKLFSITKTILLCVYTR